MQRKLFGLALLSIAFSSISCTNEKELQLFETKSITPKQEKIGKWLVTISVGGESGDVENTLMLRNLFVDVFPKTAGGLYEHAIDLDDTRETSIFPSKSNILEEINKLANKIRLFSKSNPSAKKLVMFSMTGHGLTQDGNYSFLAADQAQIYGDEIVSMIRSLGSDETILIMQSCESGSLPNKHFQDLNIRTLAINIQKKAVKNSTALAVITPVDEATSSASLIWEQYILRESFTDSNADRNKDYIVSYEEWKNYVMQVSCDLAEYGMNPQFYDLKMPGGLPLLLTKEGVSRFNNNSLIIPTYSEKPAVIWDETKNICD